MAHHCPRSGTTSAGGAKHYYVKEMPHLRAVGDTVRSDKVGFFKGKLSRRIVELFESVAASERRDLKYDGPDKSSKRRLENLP